MNDITPRINGINAIANTERTQTGASNQHRKNTMQDGAGKKTWRQAKAERAAGWERAKKSIPECVIDAARFGQPEKLQDLVVKNSIVSKELLTTALFRAVKVPSPQCTRILLERGADPKVQRESDRSTPLLLAIQARSLQCVKLLLDAGADVTVKGAYDFSPSMSAMLEKDCTPDGNKIFALIERAEIAARPKLRVKRPQGGK